ncbi:hypothetical protein G6F57_020454 [Rhizopus arrhizus]|nr:hypothetical protein G6F57_020454 [Rhizopus arrhizus]
MRLSRSSAPQYAPNASATAVAAAATWDHNCELRSMGSDIAGKRADRLEVLGDLGSRNAATVLGLDGQRDVHRSQGITQASGNQLRIGGDFLHDERLDDLADLGVEFLLGMHR